MLLNPSPDEWVDANKAVVVLSFNPKTGHFESTSYITGRRFVGDCQVKSWAKNGWLVL